MEKATTLYVFRHEDAEFCYDSDNLRLMKGSTRISLEHKPREVLAHLLKNPQKLIRYQELKTAVWGKTHVEDASVHNAVSKVNVALKRAQPGADFIRTVPGVGVEILVDVDPAATTSPSITAETGVNDSTEPRASEEPDPHESLHAISPTLHFKIDWRDPPYTSLTLHVDQPLFEGFPGDCRSASISSSTRNSSSVISASVIVSPMFFALRMRKHRRTRAPFGVSIASSSRFFGHPGPWPDVDGLPIRTAGGTAVQLRLRRVAALPAAEDAVGTLFVRPAQPTLVQHRPDQEANARVFRPVAGRAYSGSSSASMASCAMTSDTAADLWTIGTAPV
jgi:DNA-binding winged helix-turn-helix (wHTH) protein